MTGDRVKRGLIAAMLAGLLAGGSAVAQQTLPADGAGTAVVEAAWQDSITAQIEAFRISDGATALEMAGQAFRDSFDDPAAFAESIRLSGYEPIVRSRSHSFGSFEMIGEDQVLQVVNFVGPDQFLYEGLYQMAREAPGWRVQGVALRRQEGVGI